MRCGGGHVPYLVQVFSSQDMTVEVLPDQQSLIFTLSVSISPGVCVCVCWVGWGGGCYMPYLVQELHSPGLDCGSLA